MSRSSWKIEWSDSLSMSNPDIDAEHQYFIELVNQLNDEIMSQNPDKAVMERILGLLLEDAVAHFSHEERLFEEKRYPFTQEHKQIHAGIIKDFNRILETFYSTNLRAMWLAIGLKIRDLLVDHIQKDDRKYIDYLKTIQRSQSYSKKSFARVSTE